MFIIPSYQIHPTLERSDFLALRCTSPHPKNLRVEVCGGGSQMAQEKCKRVSVQVENINETHFSNKE